MVKREEREGFVWMKKEREDFVRIQKEGKALCEYKRERSLCPNTKEREGFVEDNEWNAFVGPTVSLLDDLPLVLEALFPSPAHCLKHNCHRLTQFSLLTIFCPRDKLIVRPSLVEAGLEVLKAESFPFTF